MREDGGERDTYILLRLTFDTANCELVIHSLSAKEYLIESTYRWKEKTVLEPPRSTAGGWLDGDGGYLFLYRFD